MYKIRIVNFLKKQRIKYLQFLQQQIQTNTNCNKTNKNQFRIYKIPHQQQLNMKKETKKLIHLTNPHIHQHPHNKL